LKIRLMQASKPHMPRPTLLVAEPEPIQALSVRKLVLETAKFNVLTAHSNREALDIFHLFPNISAAVLVGESGLDCDLIANSIRNTTDKVPIIFLSGRIAGRCEYANHNLQTGEPERLLELVRSLLGDPRELDSKQA
jgi:CheY-like chemotaxis protein